ncbi:hypothetical protein KGM_202865 [Danaus plexippus plexippus]|uniref:Uncharacterized protein n=1 Tax=Danaus plexippus plexippus TaxID=278856 RepID=A0A212F217_DANPL|nr:hypothetical protein KGM_202865 [Danaus plexippus plexippus]
MSRSGLILRQHGLSKCRSCVLELSLRSASAGTDEESGDLIKSPSPPPSHVRAARADIVLLVTTSLLVEFTFIIAFLCLTQAPVAMPADG